VWRQWLQRSSSGDTALSSIGDRLKAAREQAGHTLDHLAALTGLSKATFRTSDRPSANLDIYFIDIGPTGQELYDYAQEAARQLGWKLNGPVGPPALGFPRFQCTFTRTQQGRNGPALVAAYIFLSWQFLR
jgi:hypothetical protein